MKKIFGILSLIAVFTVAFSTKAVASDVDDVNVEYVASLNSTDFVSVAVVDVTTLSGVLNVADESVSYTAKGEVVDSANIVSRVFTNTSSTNYATVFLPIEVGLSNTNSTNKASNLNSVTSYANGYEVPDTVKRISANIGKLTIPIRS